MIVKGKKSGYSHILWDCWRVLIGTTVAEDTLELYIKNLDIYIFSSSKSVWMVVLKKQLENGSKIHEDKCLLPY